MLLHGRVAWVTGGGRGIGRAIAERLARDGARVIVSGRSAAELAAVAERIGGSALVMDVGSRDSLRAGLEAAAGLHGPVDILVNNAGVADSASLAATTDEIWDRALDVNVTGAFILCRGTIPSMIARGFGRVINVASNAGLTGCAYTSAYGASKHALVGLTRSIAMEIARTPVTINAVCPGWVDTRMAEEAAGRIATKTGRSDTDARVTLERMSPQQRLIEPDEVAHAVASLCAHEARGVHGQAIVIDGGQVMK